MATDQGTRMTAEDLLALPDNGMDRELIRGELRERPMTVRNRVHCLIESNVVWLLNSWLKSQPGPRGAVYSGEVGCILRRNPDTTVGIDVAYVSEAQLAAQTSRTTLLEGPPILAVEILSPSDRIEEINEKIDEYLSAGVPFVWVIDARRRTVAVYRPDAEGAMFNVTQELTAEPHLPGFRARVADLFI